MKTGTTQFLYCCDVMFTKNFRAFSKELKKVKGRFISLQEEEGFDNASRHRGYNTLHKVGTKNRKCEKVSRCTIVYEVPNG
jgi:hypothetical protein